MCFSLFEWFGGHASTGCAHPLLGICLRMGALFSAIDQVTGGWKTGEVLARCVLGLTVHFWEIFPSQTGLTAAPSRGYLSCDFGGLCGSLVWRLRFS